MQLIEILKTAHEHEASDVHLISAHPPMMRVNTVMTPMDYPILTPESVRRTLENIVDAEQKRRFDEVKDLDFSYEIEGLARYRVNAHMQRGTCGLALRAIKTKVPPLEGLNLPEVISRLTYLPRGLVLVTGDTGSGKSTTLAAMMQAMNDPCRASRPACGTPCGRIRTSSWSARCAISPRPRWPSPPPRRATWSSRPSTR
jgi:twitching motility protein PilT